MYSLVSFSIVVGVGPIRPGTTPEPGPPAPEGEGDAGVRVGSPRRRARLTVPPGRGPLEWGVTAAGGLPTAAAAAGPRAFQSRGSVQMIGCRMTGSESGIEPSGSSGRTA